MDSMVRRVLACVAVGGLALAVSTVSAADDKEKVYTTSEIMKKGNNGPKSLRVVLGNQVKQSKWDEAGTGAKKLKEYGESLGKNKPEKGDDESWKKLTEQYKSYTDAVAEAVEKKDAKAAAEALGKIQGSCKGCHTVHR